MTSDTIKIQLDQGTGEISPDILPKKKNPKSYTRIPFSIEIILIMFGKFGHLNDGSNSQESVNL